MPPLLDPPAVTPLTYPARPINGGPLDKAPPKTGDWVYEPKYNGWRTLIHVPTGTMFNRHGEPLSIAGEFATALRELQRAPFEWLDCEGLERRHQRGRGTLIVLDAVMHGTYRERRGWLEDQFKAEPGPWFIGDASAYIPATVTTEDAPKAWDILQLRNRETGCEFYEGLVAKRADSRYPIQLRRADETFPFWVKHRWAF